MSVALAVLASGGGTNLQALLDRFSGDGPARVALVISDRADAGALHRAAGAGVPALHIPVRGRAPEDVARETLVAFREHHIGLVALAGYLRLVPASVTAAFRGRILNIHPALLPAFGGRGMYGRHVHEAVLAAGCRVTGATVHRVDERYDEGQVLAQWPVPVLPGDTADTLAARVLRVEHLLYPAVIAAVASRLDATGGSAAARDAAVGDAAHGGMPPAATAGRNGGHDAPGLPGVLFRLAADDGGLGSEITAIAGL